MQTQLWFSSNSVMWLALTNMTKQWEWRPLLRPKMFPGSSYFNCPHCIGWVTQIIIRPLQGLWSSRVLMERPQEYFPQSIHTCIIYTATIICIWLSGWGLCVEKKGFGNMTHDIAYKGVWFNFFPWSHAKKKAVQQNCNNALQYL